jgi:hypothetical protein
MGLRAIVAMVVVLSASSCHSGKPDAPVTQGPPGNHADPDRSGTPPPPPGDGTATRCPSDQIWVPGGTSRNGIGATVELPPAHCAPLPAACNGVASCGCVGQMCAVGGCVSVEGGELSCLAG